MTIHSEHPFATPAGDRDPLRRFRGRMASAVSVWSAGAGRARVGWTVSSFLVADGEPGEVVGVLDEDSALGELLADGGDQTFVVNLLGWEQRGLADAFAGRLRDEVDITAVTSDLHATIHRALDPSGLGLWLREPTGADR